MPEIHGFLAMEYYFGILNRSYAIFTFPNGLYGWKFCGPISAFTPFFFVPFQEVVNDPKLVPGSEDLKGLMKSSGSFFIGRSQIASADYDPTPKWGMGPVPHSGKLYIHLKSGKPREFILLGEQNGEAVRDAVLSGSSIMVPFESENQSY